MPLLENKRIKSVRSTAYQCHSTPLLYSMMITIIPPFTMGITCNNRNNNVSVGRRKKERRKETKP